jgi:hypothetical protein
MIVLACSSCSPIAVALLPIALWIFVKIRKNHKCPCDCHNEPVRTGSYIPPKSQVDPPKWPSEALLEEKYERKIHWNIWQCTVCKKEFDKTKDFSCDCKASPVPLIPIRKK